ncbi:homoprotocatechuate degradation operon regulator HpaR [Leucobacter sp. CSA1]|uniref:Homoprotocatechuate degradation operon regulator HpaR n=1 Tax=Leucobacter chromiisoli TaxID=2796471 RepID=A0A934UUF6_9MICO|nr:homoprotocatechuate degradation operon regulator HpaR [Leucobacter chromiisoli]MBK0417887.1 homoprotocatechuate degradation operon regulator HpaR [Leucobacter chromiisoli]
MREIAEMLPLQFLQAREVMMQRFRPILHAAGFTETQWRVLRVVHAHGSVTFSELSEESVISKPSLSRILANLESRRFLQRTNGEEDQRQVHLSLTAAGSELVASLGPDIEQEYERISQQIGGDPLVELSEALSTFVDSLRSAHDG